MDDLVTRLRNKDWLWTVPGALREEAADEIERLQHDIERHIAICGTQEQEIERLTRELDVQRDSQISAVNGMLKAEQDCDRLTRERDTARTAVWAAIPWLDDLEHMGSLVDQTRRAQTAKMLLSAVRASEQEVQPTVYLTQHWPHCTALQTGVPDDCDCPHRARS